LKSSAAAGLLSTSLSQGAVGLVELLAAVAVQAVIALLLLAKALAVAHLPNQP
jgi:hypothetical protein